MPFCDNLCLLMKIQNVTSSRLAKALSVDTSLISRWRKGTRMPGKNSGYIHAIAAYFSMHAELDYQKTALCEVMGIRPDGKRKNERSLTDALENWLSSGIESDTSAFEGFFKGLSDYKGMPKLPSDSVSSDALPSGQAATSEVFFGIEGKQQGVLKFLALTAEQKTPQTLLLYSDEDMDWLISDRVFLEKWALLLSQAIMKGNKIKIIHTVNRDLTEMLVAIERWLPLYMTNAIEPYYYPKYRAGIFRRTMFILPGVAALTSESLADQSALSANTLHTNPKVLQSLKNTFLAYLALCRPLMHIMTQHNPSDILQLLREFDSQLGDFFYKANSPSFLSMPPELFDRLLQRVGSPHISAEILLDLHKQRIQIFLKNLEAHQYTEIVNLPSIEDILGRRVMIPFSVLFGSQTVYYTPAEFTDHLRNILSLLQNYKNYNFYIFANALSGINLTVKEDVGAIVTKGTMPTAVFAFNQLSMTDCFFNYMRNDQNKIPLRDRTKKSCIKKLEVYLKKLEDAQTLP